MDTHPLIEKALVSHDTAQALITLLYSEDTAVEAAVNLAEYADSRALEPLLKRFEQDLHPAYSYALTVLDCSGHELELIRLALTAKIESQHHVVEILGNVHEIEEKSAKTIIAAIELQKELLSQESVTNISAKKFLTSAESIVSRIPFKEVVNTISVDNVVPIQKTAKILNFPTKK